MIELEQFFCLNDNLGYVLHDRDSGKTATIDAPEAEPILSALERRGWGLDLIMITHHHADHTQAIPTLKQRTGARVIAPLAEAARIEQVDRPVSPGDTVQLGETVLEVLATPGHTTGHIAYFERKTARLFCGDALFSLGCGRMFEGEPQAMWAGLAALRELPDETKIYCGHEYSATNARFALSVDPDNSSLQNRAAEIDRQRAAGHSTIPARLDNEKRQNPFLRADDPQLAARLGLAGAPAFEVFAKLRALKDQF